MTPEEKKLNEIVVAHVMTGPIPVVSDDDKITHYLRPQNDMSYTKAEAPFDVEWVE